MRLGTIQAFNKPLSYQVQKFVIMSVANSYMDFHLDFGGTSVWYYLLRGLKIFWLIPPTDKNLLLYEQWVKSEDKTKFLGDICEGCCRYYIKNYTYKTLDTTKSRQTNCGQYETLPF